VQHDHRLLAGQFDVTERAADHGRARREHAQVIEIAAVLHETAGRRFTEDFRRLGKRFLGRALEKVAVPFVRSVVALNEFTNVDRALPHARRKSPPRGLKDLAYRFHIVCHISLLPTFNLI
jgi:hypothetical protein